MAAETLWERLGIQEALRRQLTRHGKNPLWERALFAMTANRLCEPESKLGVWDRWLDTVHFPAGKDLKLDHMYAAMDFFHAHAGEVEKDVFYQTANLFNLKEDLIFYDTTTASFAIDEEDGFRMYGRGKDGTWGPQVVVALAVTNEGLPVRSWVFPGNTTDVNT